MRTAVGPKEGIGAAGHQGASQFIKFFASSYVIDGLEEGEQGSNACFLDRVFIHKCTPEGRDKSGVRVIKSAGNSIVANIPATFFGKIAQRVESAVDWPVSGDFMRCNPASIDVTIKIVLRADVGIDVRGL